MMKFPRAVLMGPAPSSTTDSRDLGLLLLRTGVGATLAVHGTQKLFGWFGGHGLANTGAAFDSMGFAPGKVNAVLAGLGEAGGGAMLALGLATPAAGASAAGTMAVAAAMSKDKGFLAANGGYEYPAMLALSAAAIALAGPGQLSVDAALGHVVNRHWMRAAALGGVTVAAGLVFRRRTATLAAASSTAAGDGSGSAE